MKKVPTIKGIFVMSHVRALERARGSEAVLELVERLGKRVRYRSTEDVPVRDEVAIIEHVLDILAKKPIPRGKREFEAGRLHFNNFSETSLGGLVLNMSSFKYALLKVPWIAKRVFNGVHFRSEEMSARSVCITMENNDYPIEHFEGFFQAWMEYCGFKGNIHAEDLGHDVYAYTVRWK